MYTGQMTFLEYSQQTMSITVPVILTISDPHVPATIAATSGTPQTAAVAKAFAESHGGDGKRLLGRSSVWRVGDVQPLHQRGQRDLRLFRNTAITNGRGRGYVAGVHGQYDIAGKYAVTATAGTLTTNPGFALTNKCGRARFHRGHRRNAAIHDREHGVRHAIWPRR